MRYLIPFLLLLPLQACLAQSVPPGSTVTFYITDENLVTDHRGVMTLSTAGLVDFTINGIPISGPSSMVETGIDTGVFQLQLELPQSVGGKPLQNGDVVLMTYHQPSDYSGNPSTLTQSVTISSLPTTPAEPVQQSINIGQYFTLYLNAPNYNLDSQVPDDIPLDLVEVHMGGVSTTLADPAFYIGTGSLRETGPDTNVFSATFKIPRQIDGFPVDIGSTLEFRVTDNSQPVQSESSIFLTIGAHSAATQPAHAFSGPRSIEVKTTSASGTRVYYENSTVLQGLGGPVCYPESGSSFPIGTTTVTCSATNQEGTSVLRSFSVTVKHEAGTIPHWVKGLAGFWCKGDISDGQFGDSLRFLNASGIIAVYPQGQVLSVDKAGICSWSEGGIHDDNILDLFGPLVR